MTTRQYWTARGTAILLLLSLPTSGQSQTVAPSFDELSAQLSPNEKVIVTDLTGQQITGRPSRLTSTNIQLLLEDASSRTFDSTSVGRIVVKDPVRNGAIIGAIAGVIPGLVGGFLLNAICINETGACPAAPVLLGVLGAAGGAAIGAGVDGLRHKVVYETRPDLRREYVPEFFATVGWEYARVTGVGNAFSISGPAHLSLGWSTRWASGLGFELSMAHTMGQSIRHVACVRAEGPFFSPDVAGTCIGSGHEGVRSQVLGSAKVLYEFRTPRVQPFLTAGLGAFESAIVRPSSGGGFRGATPFVVQQTSHHWGVAFSAGGGLRIPLSEKVSLRTEVSHYASGILNQTRAAVGLGYAW